VTIHSPHEVADHCLAHKVGNDVSRAYQRGKQFKKRVELMQLWADYLTGKGDGENVVKLKMGLSVGAVGLKRSSTSPVPRRPSLHRSSHDHHD